MQTRRLFRALVPLTLATALMVGGASHTEAADAQATILIGGDAQQETSLVPVEVERLLQGLRGVKDATVSDGGTEAIVTYDSALVNVTQLVQALRDAGYRAMAAP